MPSIEYDVFVAFHDPTGRDLATRIAAGLRQRGFHVWLDDGTEASVLDDRLGNVIEDIPDFVAILTPDALDQAGEGGTRLQRAIALAVETDRSLVPVAVPGFVRPGSAALPPWAEALLRVQGVSYNPDSHDESVALIAHMLSSEAAVNDRRLMRDVKRVGLTVGGAFLVVLAISIAQALPRLLARKAEAPPLPPFVHYWAGFGQRFEQGRWTEFSVQDGTRLFAGDQVRMVFRPSADGYAYVLARNLRGEIGVLFPQGGVRPDSHVRAGELYEAPAGGEWFIVDTLAGVDTFFIVSGYDRIHNLEALAEEHFEEASVQARQALLTSTIAGVLDGRHAAVARGLRTSKGQRIVQSLALAPVVVTASVTLADGARVTRELVPQLGLLSALSELKVRFEPSR